MAFGLYSHGISMNPSFVATVGNGRLLAHVGADGSLVGLAGPGLGTELLERPVHAALELGGGRTLEIAGRGWKHHLEYVRGTNVLRVISSHSRRVHLERRLVALGDSLNFAFKCEGVAEARWSLGIEGVLPRTGLRFEGGWPEGFDSPPLGGATRASVVEGISDLSDRTAAANLYARSVLVIAQHHDLSGAFVAQGSDVLLAHALDVCGERGAARAFFEWAVGHRRPDAQLSWGLEQHLRRARNVSLRTRLDAIQAGYGQEAPPLPSHGTSAALWTAWQDAKAGNRASAIAILETAMAERSAQDLFLAGGGVDLDAHALFLLTVHGLLAPRTEGEDGFFEHQADTQKMRRSRALYGGAYHGGTPEPYQLGSLVAETPPALDVSAVTVEFADREPHPMERVPGHDGAPARWSGRIPPSTTGQMTRYRIRAHLRDSDAPPTWASDSDPRPGGQEFALETAAPPPPEWVHDAVCYQVMVDRFARPGTSLPAPGDPTALYGGTLDGVAEHLDHIAALGCSVLWLSPVHKAPSHHGYDIEDFFQVEPRYGGDEALVRLVEAAHGRGMRVLLDFVPNHTGRGHHLFKDAMAEDGGAAAHYRFWQWPHYYRCFADVVSLPELDTGNPAVQDHLLRAARHWLTGYGVDGIRCDHVAGVDPAFWVTLRRGLREVKPDALILGEATGTTHWLARYAGRLDAIFDFDLAYYVRQTVARGRMDAAAFADWLDNHDGAYPGLALANLLDNHDMNRFLWMANGSIDRLKLGATLLMTLPGMPVIYYGTEVGLSQRYDGVVENAEARLPMLWGDDQNQDVVAHFQWLGRMRRRSAALRRGQRRTVLADAEVFAYERSAGDERVLVALNFSERAQHRVLRGIGPIELGPLSSVVVSGSD